MSATFAPHSYTVVSVPTTTVYLRRRLLAGVVALAIVLAVMVGAGNVLANRGGAPASTSAVRPASVTAVAGGTYLVQPGDTLWSIAAAVHGGAAPVEYVDTLVALNGGAALQVGQVISLP
jgi:nucleoid-associated protein YgaU